MPDVEIGYEPFTDEDRIYAGSRFRDVVDALFANPYQPRESSEPATAPCTPSCWPP